MGYEEACDAEITLREAIDELYSHGVTADYEESTGEIFDCASGETIAFPLVAAGGDYMGADILNYLGY